MQAKLAQRQFVMLAALAAESGAEFAPVQVQKLFFLLDENIAPEMGGKQFDFQPYDYGPFDKLVYQELDRLAAVGLVQLTYRGSGAGGRRYSLTPEGYAIGEKILNGAPPRARDYIRAAAQWVRSLSFASLVGSIYRSYPHMRANSIFQE